jgi:glycosyltransferase involved in cell wall biosynthesis
LNGGLVRLLLSIPYYAPAYAFGGSVTVAETVVGGFLDAGWEVTVVTTDVFDEHRRVDADVAAVPSGASVVRFENVSHRLAAAQNGYLPRGLRSWLRAHAAEFDVALLQDVYSALSVMTARACARAGVPYAVQPLGTVGAMAERGRPLVKNVFLALWGRKTLAGAAALIHSTEHERGDFLSVGAPSGTLVKLPLPLELPSPTGIARTASPTVAYVGRLHPIKGIDRLIRAVDIAGVHLDVVGPGERFQRELEAGVGDADVTFHGFVSDAERERFLSSAWVFSLLSDAEGLPMAALEAMSCGTPVVLSEGCHIPEVDGVAGIVTDGSPEPTARALRALLDDPARREELGRGAREFAAGFRREVVMPQMVQVLGGLVR